MEAVNFDVCHELAFAMTYRDFSHVTVQTVECTTEPVFSDSSLALHVTMVHKSKS